jgi:ribonucleotide reductase, class II
MSDVAIAVPENHFPTQYQEFIHLSRYARWMDDKGRRETWPETVDRYVNFMFDKQIEGKLAEYKEEVRQAIIKLEVMPSMRCMMTAGSALEKDNAAAYNCSYLAIDDPCAFDEMLYILMCGSGVGFSVERQFIDKLPVVAENLRKSMSTIAIEDSKIGWANAFRELITMLYQGRIPKFDASAVRPAGARLKTFGGRASGPGPLLDLFNFCVTTFKNAAGRKLNSIECHDICCKIGEIVVVGGVRRSALISLSNLSDDRMRYAKSGEWWKDNQQRSMANNSVCYTERPECDRFMREWLSLMDSKSGERGIFNRAAAKRNVEKYGRRDPNHEFGSNPCVTADTWTMTDEGPKQVNDLIDKPFVAVVDSCAYECYTGFFQTGVKKVYSVSTDRGYSIRGTFDHPVKVEVSRRTVYERVNGRKLKAGYDRQHEWRNIGDLKPGDKVVISKNDFVSWGEENEEEIGWLVGNIVGNGGYNPDKYPTYLRFWDADGKDMADYAADIIKRRLNPTNHFKGASCNEINGTWQVACVALDDLCDGLIEKKTKNILPVLEKKSSSFLCGFLQGFFDADGSPQGNVAKGRSVRLSQAGTDKLQSVQRILARLGIASTITSVRNEPGPRMMPDGRGGQKEYDIREMYELIVARNCIDTYAERIGFVRRHKAEKLVELCESVTRCGSYEDTFTTKVKAVDEVGEEAVYDCTVENAHCFDANGLIAHNCSEIILRSCGFCNLSEMVVRPEDTVEDLKRKVRLATIIGTVQSSMTNFRYLRSVWKTNAEEERLLGVSMTGIMDNVLTAGKDGGKREGTKKLAQTLSELRQYAVEVNREFAAKIGVTPSMAITCVKPSGTVSQLVDCASGIHPRFSHYYIRTVRADSKDPLAKLMQALGFPSEPDVTKPEHNVVFSFPMKCSENSVVVDDVSALDQLELWLVYQRHWTEHKPSITVYVKDNEWMEVGAWVYRNFDEVSGIAFLPYSGHTYRQAPYQEVDKAEYEELAQKMPTDVDWSLLSAYEVDDSAIIGYKELACSGGKCEEVDVTRSEPPTILGDGSGTKQ